MTGLTWEALEPLLQRGQPVTRVVALLKDATEAERRRCSKAVMDAVHGTFPKPRYRDENLVVAAFGCGPEGRLRRSLDELAWLTPGRSQVAFEVLADRNPPWLESLTTALLAGRGDGAFWPLVNRLVRAGLVARPGTGDYGAGMVQAMIDFRYYSYHDAPRLPEWSVEQRLRADPELLGRDLDEVFTSEGAARALASLRDDHPAGTHGWLAALTALAADGTIDRGRLLDGVLTALRQDWATAATTRWYLNLWRRLETLVDELAERQERLTRVLASPVAGAVTLALKELERLARTGRLDQAAFVEAAAPALYRPEKEPVVVALRLLDRCAAASPALADAVLGRAAVALAHDRLDVQERALCILTKRWEAAGEATAAAVAVALDSTSPTLRQAVAALLGTDGGGEGETGDTGGPAAEAAEELSVLAARAAGVPERPAARLGLPAALAAARAGRLPAALPPDAVGGPGCPLEPPPADADELMDLFTRLLAGVDDPLDLERAMAGLARLGRAAPHERARAGALLAQARADAQGNRPFMGRDLRADAVGLVLAWLDGHGAPPTHPDPAPSRARSMLMEQPWFTARERDRERALHPWHHRTASLDLNGFASTRAWEVAIRVSGGVTGELLAMPTHERGGIDPRVLVERVGRAEGAAEGRAGRLDLAQALLRTAGWDEGARAEARAAAQALTSPAGATLRRALGDLDAPIPGDPVLARAAGWAAGAWAETVAALWPITGAVTPAPWKWGRDEQLGIAFLYHLPPTGLPIRLDDPVTLLCDLDDPLPWCDVRAERAIHWYTPQREQLTSSQVLACPAALELVVAHGLPHLNRALTRQMAAAAGVLDPLTHAEAPLGPVGLTAVALGTGAVDARLRALSADVLVQAAADGRLDGVALGGRLGELLVTVGLKPARVAATLRQAAMASPVATARIADCLVAAVPPAVKAGMRDAHRLVELLAELLAEHGRAAEDGVLRAAVEPLAAQAKRNRLAAGSARLLGLAPRAYSDARAQAARQAVEALLERASAAR